MARGVRSDKTFCLSLLLEGGWTKMVPCLTVTLTVVVPRDLPEARLRPQRLTALTTRLILSHVGDQTTTTVATCLRTVILCRLAGSTSTTR